MTTCDDHRWCIGNREPHGGGGGGGGGGGDSGGGSGDSDSDSGSVVVVGMTVLVRKDVDQENVRHAGQWI